MPKKPVALRIHALAKIPFEIYQEHLATNPNQDAISINQLIAPDSQKIILDTIFDEGVGVHYAFCNFDMVIGGNKNLEYKKVCINDKEIELRAWHYLLEYYQQTQKLDAALTKNIKDKIPKEVFYELTHKKLTLDNLCSLRNNNYNDYKNAVKKQKRINKSQAMQPKNFAQLIEIATRKQLQHIKAK